MKQQGLSSFSKTGFVVLENVGIVLRLTRKGYTAYGKTIELFLVNGSPDGLITAALSNWNGNAAQVCCCNKKKGMEPAVGSVPFFVVQSHFMRHSIKPVFDKANSAPVPRHSVSVDLCASVMKLPHTKAIHSGPKNRSRSIPPARFRQAVCKAHSSAGSTSIRTFIVASLLPSMYS